MDSLLDLIIRLLWVGIYSAALLILTIADWRLIRVYLSKTEFKQTDYLESFQKLHEEGKLTAEEFRIIKKLLSLQLNRTPREAKPDYSLLNKSTPSLSTDQKSGKMPKN